jgi:hypothetical protein
MSTETPYMRLIHGCLFLVDVAIAWTADMLRFNR